MGNDVKVTDGRIVFCTSCIDLDKQRYQDWIDYYTDFFKDCGIDLLMINDGPVTEHVDLKSVELKTFEEKLGRQACWIFPGWKRSFYHAILWSKNHSHVAYIESDCYITAKGKEVFLEHLDKDGYFTAFTPKYNFPEPAISIINDLNVRKAFLDKYAGPESWNVEESFEDYLRELNPRYIMTGDRIEGDISKVTEQFTYWAQTDYQNFKKYYEDRRGFWVS